MITFANQTTFDTSGMLFSAQKGILNPRRRELFGSNTMYRFGNTIDLAMRGSWWIEESQFMLIREWAEFHGLDLPHAIRMLSPVAGDYGAMLCLVRAQVKAPLHAYEGIGRSQRLAYGGRINEFLAGWASELGPTITQLFIPGLRDARLSDASLTRLSVQRFAESASHIIKRPIVR